MSFLKGFLWGASLWNNFKISAGTYDTVDPVEISRISCNVN